MVVGGLVETKEDGDVVVEVKVRARAAKYELHVLGGWESQGSV